MVAGKDIVSIADLLGTAPTNAPAFLESPIQTLRNRELALGKHNADQSCIGCVQHITGVLSRDSARPLGIDHEHYSICPVAQRRSFS